MAKRWSSPQKRFWVYQYLVARDGGERCLICHKGPSTKRRLEVDHIDNDALNNDPENLCLLCSTCNKSFETVTPAVKKKVLLKAKRGCACVCVCENGNPSTSITKSQINYVKGSPEMQANDFFELDFRKWILTQVREHGEYPKSEAINSGAEAVGCSTETSRRYLMKLTSAGGVLQEYKNLLRQTMLRFKPERVFPVNGPVDIDELLKSALAYQVKKPERSE